MQTFTTFLLGLLTSSGPHKIFLHDGSFSQHKAIMPLSFQQPKIFHDSQQLQRCEPLLNLSELTSGRRRNHHLHQKEGFEPNEDEDDTVTIDQILDVDGEEDQNGSACEDEVDGGESHARKFSTLSGPR